MWRGAGIFLVESALAIALVVAPMAFPDLEPTTGYWILGGCAWLLALGAMLWLWPEKAKQIEARAMGDDYSIKTGDISGGTNRIGHEFHKPPQRTMTSEMKADLLRDLPNDRPVVVRGMNGNTESMTFANEIHSFLRENNHTMKESSATWHMFFNPPIFNVSIKEGEGGKEWWITVGPAE